MENNSINPNRFLREWIGNSIYIWLIAAVVCFIALVPFAILYGVFHQEGVSLEVMRWFMAIALMTIPGVVIGYTVGDRQENLIEYHLHWSLKGWTRLSMLGGFFGGLVVVAKALAFQPLAGHPYLLMLNMPLYVLCLSIGQWFILRQVAREAWLWVLGNVVGGIVFSGILFLNQPSPTHPAYGWILLGLWGLATVGQGIITGIIILWLYDRPIDEWDDDDAELAPVYLEVRTRSDRRE